MKAVVLGATGYTGQILLRQLSGHPDVDAIIPVSSSKAGREVLREDPGLHPSLLEKMDGTGGLYASVDQAAASGADVVFSALPHLASAGVCAPFFGKTVVIDLSADFRIADPALFREAYDAAPPREDLLPRAVYGLSEWNGRALREADLIANPGCYPTATLLPLLPLARAGLLASDPVVNALSGISGAGRKAKIGNLLVERAENVCAYAPGRTHRHSWEIRQELAKEAEGRSLLFTPHLVPMKRGMAVTTAVKVPAGTGNETIAELYREAYGEKPFVKTAHPALPETKQVWGSNRCDIGWRLDGEDLLLFSVIDNLIKGASGQAVQNMNLRFGLKESAGLNLHGEI